MYFDFRKNDVYFTYTLRWSGNTRNWSHIAEVALNPTNEIKINKEKAA
jgi:hypothetical protein